MTEKQHLSAIADHLESISLKYGELWTLESTNPNGQEDNALDQIRQEIEQAFTEVMQHLKAAPPGSVRGALERRIQQFKVDLGGISSETEPSRGDAWRDQLMDEAHRYRLSDTFGDAK